MGGTSAIQEELGRDADLSEGVECYTIGCGGVLQRASARCRAGHVGQRLEKGGEDYGHGFVWGDRDDYNGKSARAGE